MSALLFVLAIATTLLGVVITIVGLNLPPDVGFTTPIRYTIAGIGIVIVFASWAFIAYPYH